MTSQATSDFFVSTPYVDAYKTSENRSFDEFRAAMLDQALWHGEQGLGVALLKGEPVPAIDDGVYVLAMGRFGDVEYVAVQKAGSDDTDVVEFTWPAEWDVT